MEERLNLARQLYEPCTLGCDIGTDHGLLPGMLLRQHVCRYMIASDISDKALSHAREHISRSGLSPCTHFVCTDGLSALPDAEHPVFGQTRCGCVSILGMGGDTVSAMLRNRPGRLQGAVLVVSVHSELPAVRLALQDISYAIRQERLVYEGGRFYVIWRAEPGSMYLSEEEILYGTQQLFSPGPDLIPYLHFRLSVFEKQLMGMRRAKNPSQTEQLIAEQAVRFYRGCLDRAEDTLRKQDFTHGNDLSDGL